jgi:hypothetical protein
MGWLPVLMGAVAVVIFCGLGEIAWLAASTVATIGDFWSFGVMHNYAMGRRQGGPGPTASFGILDSQRLGSELDYDDQPCFLDGRFRFIRSCTDRCSVTSAGDCGSRRGVAGLQTLRVELAR